jgi:predicted dehydrogenase
MALRVGIIGAGGIGTLHAETAARTGVEIRAVCDTRIARATKLAGQFKGAATTDDAAELLADDSIDAVVIAVPNLHHARLAIAALNAGKHVLLEKPMAISVGQCDAVLGAMRRASRVVQLGFVSRCAPAARAAERAVAEGRLGRIYHVKAAMYRRRGIPGLGRWFTTKAESGGGVLIDLGVHMIDLVMHLTGAPRPLSAFGTASSTHGKPIGEYHAKDMWAGPPDTDGVFDVEDAIAASVQFDGMTFELNAMWAGNFPDGSLRDGIVLLGEKGGCHIELWKHKFALAVEKSGEVSDLTPELADVDPWTTAWEEEWRLFADAIATGSPPNATAEDGRRVQTVVDAIYRSCASGRNEKVEQ